MRTTRTEKAAFCSLPILASAARAAWPRPASVRTGASLALKCSLPPSQIQRDAATTLQPYFTPNGLVTKALEHAFKLEHIMDLTRLRCLGSLFSMLHQACRNVAQYNANHPDFPMQMEQLERYIQVGRGPGASVGVAVAPRLGGGG